METQRQIYLVGGAVRDLLLGIESKDRDYVVVGATPEEMIAEGYSMVGADFPVFLHPETGEEYALARTERKTGPGYGGFVTDHSKEVTLRDDLERRDLTVNAMALTKDNQLIDYFGGLRDLEKKLLRHVGPAFAEDPVRVLRVARFAARYFWQIANETKDLMRQMIKAGELDHLTKERVYKEFEKGFSEEKAGVMINELASVGFFELPAFKGLNTLSCGTILNGNYSTEVKLCIAFRKCRDLKERCFPTDIVDAVEIMSAIGDVVENYFFLSSKERLEKVIVAGKALRQPKQFALALEALERINYSTYALIRRDVLLLKEAKFGELIPPELKGLQIKTYVDTLKIAMLEEATIWDRAPKVS